MRCAGPGARLNELRWPAKPDYAHVDALVYAARERLFEEDRKSRNCCCAAIHPLQFRPHPQDAENHACNGCWHLRPCLELWRNSGSGSVKPASMAPMDHSSYWYQYFAARRDVEFYLGLGSIAFALISMVTGKTLDRYQGIVSRAENPKGFWGNVAVVSAMGAIFLGLFLFGPS